MNCSGHGEVVDGRCYCFKGWTGSEETFDYNDCHISITLHFMLGVLITFIALLLIAQSTKVLITWSYTARHTLRRFYRLSLAAGAFVLSRALLSIAGYRAAQLLILPALFQALASLGLLLGVSATVANWLETSHASLSALSAPLTTSTVASSLRPRAGLFLRTLDMCTCTAVMFTQLGPPLLNLIVPPIQSELLWRFTVAFYISCVVTIAMLMFVGAVTQGSFRQELFRLGIQEKPFLMKMRRYTAFWATAALLFTGALTAAILSPWAKRNSSWLLAGVTVFSMTYCCIESVTNAPSKQRSLRVAVSTQDSNPPSPIIPQHHIFPR